MAASACGHQTHVHVSARPISLDKTTVFTQRDSEDRILKWGPPPRGSTHPARSHPYDLQHQVVRVAFDWNRHAVSGLTELSFAPSTEGLRSIDLDAVGLTIKRVSDSSGNALQHSYDGSMLSVRFPVPLRKGTLARVFIEYEAVHPQVGVYWAGRRRVVWTQGKAEGNRHWLPTYDAPDNKVTWEFFVRTAPGERAFAVGALAGRRDVEGGVEWHWVQNRPAPTYLMTVAVGPYTVVEDTSGPVHLGYWVYPDAVNQAQEAFAAAPRAIRLFGDKLGVPLPSRRFDAIVVPDFIFWDALESWRPAVTTTVLDDHMILENGHGWPGEERDLAIARLVAQEWFGKLLTPRDWRDSWLSEGFVHFMGLVYAEEAQSVEAATHVRTWANVGTFAADRDRRRPLVFDRWEYDPIELWLTEHLQHRGAVVLNLLRYELGDSLFWQGMRHYVKKYAGGTVTTQDFRTAMEEATHGDLSRFFAQWVYGTGFPILRVSFIYDSTTRDLTLTARQVQRRDSETGFFDAPVDVEILTERGSMRRVFSLKAQEVTEEKVRLSAELRALRWDPLRLLDFDLEFPRPTPLLVYQLDHGDQGARREAISELQMRAAGMEKGGGAMMIMSDSTRAPILPPSADPAAAAALLKTARSESSPSVRAEAIRALGMLWDNTAIAALLELSHDTAAETRGAAAMSLFATPSQAAVDRIRALATSDPDPEIRETALQSIAMREPRLVLMQAESVLASPSVTDDQKADAVSLAAGSNLPEGWEIARRYVTAPDASRQVRQQASRSLSIQVFMSRSVDQADARQLVELLTPLLNSGDPSDRIVGARDIAAAKIPEARAALRERKKVEADARVLRRIDESLQEIDRPDPPWPHR
jgi:aminopeptidase N